MAAAPPRAEWAKMMPALTRSRSSRAPKLLSMSTTLAQLFRHCQRPNINRDSTNVNNSSINNSTNHDSTNIKINIDSIRTLPAAGAPTICGSLRPEIVCQRSLLRGGCKRQDSLS